MPIVHTIARYYGQLPTKFGVPRQSGVVSTLQGRIVFEPEYRNPDALRGIEDFDYLWLLWEFSENNKTKGNSQNSLPIRGERQRVGELGSGMGRGEGLFLHPTVRPPRLGGNKRMGVFATRSPYHPNNIGLSSVKLERVEWESAEGPVLYVSGADLMSGTPILDIKPYVEYADSHVGARSGFVDASDWKPLSVQYDDEVVVELSAEELCTLIALLEQDPRPHYHNDPERIYGMAFADWDVHFSVNGDTLRIAELRSLHHK